MILPEFNFMDRTYKSIDRALNRLFLAVQNSDIDHGEQIRKSLMKARIFAGLAATEIAEAHRRQRRTGRMDR